MYIHISIYKYIYICGFYTFINIIILFFFSVFPFISVLGVPLCVLKYRSRIYRFSEKHVKDGIFYYNLILQQRNSYFTHKRDI